MRRLISLAVMTVAFGLGATLAYFNTTPVQLDYLSGQSERPLIAWLLISFMLGIGLTLVLFLIRGLKMRSDLRNLRQRLTRAEAELKTLRGLPLQDT